jgi:hypothetical protein
MTLVYLLILAVVYIFLDLVMRKKLHTKMKKSYWRSFKGRRPLFVTIEMVMLAAFLVLIFVIPPAYTSVFMFLFFFSCTFFEISKNGSLKEIKKSTTTRGLAQLFSYLGRLYY